MKRASTLDRHGRQSSAQYAAAAKGGISKEENNVTADSETSSTSPHKKMKLGTGKESTLLQDIHHATAVEHRPASPVSSLRKDAADAERTNQSHVAAMRRPNASVPALRNMNSKLSSGAEDTASVPASVEMEVKGGSDPRQGDLLSPETANGSRRQQWLEKDNPSFVFDEITDPLLLALFDTTVPGDTPAATLAQFSEREQKRQFQPIANAIKKALESILADVMRKFMTAGKQEGIPKPAFQEAHHAFCELVQMFNRAKVAAVDGQEGRMVAELDSICPALDRFIARGLKDVIQNFSAEKAERECLKAGLRALLAECREWLAKDKNDAVRPWSPSFPPSSPKAKQRSVSSPVKPNEPLEQAESGKTSRLSSSFSGHISPHPSQHRMGPSSPAVTATPSLACTPLSSPLGSPSSGPLTSPVLSPKAVVSPKESTKSFRISALIGSPISPRSKDLGRKESPVKSQARQSSLNESTSRSSLPVQHIDEPVTPEKARTEKSKKPLY